MQQVGLLKLYHIITLTASQKNTILEICVLFTSILEAIYAEHVY